MFGKLFVVASARFRTLDADRGETASDMQEAPLSRALRMHSSGLEPPPSIQRTRPSTLYEKCRYVQWRPNRPYRPDSGRIGHIGRYGCCHDVATDLSRSRCDLAAPRSWRVAQSHRYDYRFADLGRGIMRGLKTCLLGGASSRLDRPPCWCWQAPRVPLWSRGCCRRDLPEPCSLSFSKSASARKATSRARKNGSASAGLELLTPAGARGFVTGRDAQAESSWPDRGCSRSN
jgi:hypothetical protein